MVDLEILVDLEKNKLGLSLSTKANLYPFSTKPWKIPKTIIDKYARV